MIRMLPVSRSLKNTRPSGAKANPTGKFSPGRTDCSCKSPVGGWLTEKFSVFVASLFTSSLWF